MTISLPHNIVNGTNANANEVMGNLNALLNQSNRSFLVDQHTDSNGTARTTIGENAAELAGSSANVTVAVPSLMIIGFSSKLVVGTNLAGEYRGMVQLAQNGNPGGFFASYQADLTAAGSATNDRITTRTLSGIGFLSLTAGSHTVSLWAVQTVTSLGGFQMAISGVQIQTGTWVGLVMPV